MRCFGIIDSVKKWFSPSKKNKPVVAKGNTGIGGQMDKRTVCINIIETLFTCGIEGWTVMPNFFFDYFDDYTPMPTNLVSILSDDILPFPCKFSDSSKDSVLKKYLDNDDLSMMASARKFFSEYPKKCSPDKIIRSGKLVFDLYKATEGAGDETEEPGHTFKEAVDKYAYRRAWVSGRKACVELKTGEKYVIVPVDVLIPEMISAIKFPACSLLEVTGVDMMLWRDKHGENGAYTTNKECYRKFEEIKKSRGTV